MLPFKPGTSGIASVGSTCQYSNTGETLQQHEACGEQVEKQACRERPRSGCVCVCMKRLGSLSDEELEAVIVHWKD